MTTIQQSPSEALNLDNAGIRMIALMGWKWFWCAMDAAEIAPTIEHVYSEKMWESFHSPTFVNDQRIRALNPLDDGTYRAQVQVSSENRAQREVILSAGTVLTCFIPKHSLEMAVYKNVPVLTTSNAELTAGN